VVYPGSFKAPVVPRNPHWHWDSRHSEIVQYRPSDDLLEGAGRDISESLKGSRMGTRGAVKHPCHPANKSTCPYRYFYRK